ncbi:unnamed protein product [Linum trigynum]|uniref:RNase H type-1 domain-containing protein n=1 Tax=Linum trigynum TaxID=586398 RepID=A0AAV2G4K4_9ROSI
MVLFDQQQICLESKAAEWRHQVNEIESAFLSASLSPAIPLRSSVPTGSAFPHDVHQFHTSFDGATGRGDAGAAAYVIGDGSSDAGMVFPIAAAATIYAGIKDAHVLETLAIRDCLKECSTRQLTSLLITGDAKVILDKCLAGDFNDSKVGAILREIKALLAGFGGYCDLRFVGRHRNREAHLVAKKSLSLSPRVLSRFDYVSWLRSL